MKVDVGTAKVACWQAYFPVGQTAADTEDRREKIQALSVAKECCSMKLDLLTNATVIDDAIRFVSHKSKDKETSVDDERAEQEMTNEVF
jgi:hypothetical protein